MLKSKPHRPWRARLTRSLRHTRRMISHGQALIEYALITALLVLAIIVALTATGPAVGNVFSNTVFNLIGAPAPSATPLNPTEFWQLVTAVASYTPDTISLATNTLAPPTNTPTFGPSPTYSPTVPTNTPTTTNTPGPTATPDDIVHSAPFYDRVVNDAWWRLDSDSVFTGFNPWTIEWWRTDPSNRTVSAVNSRMASAPYCTSTYNQPDINFYWGTGAPSPVGDCTGRTDDFASRWTRTVSFETDTNLLLTTVSDDGIRVTIDGSVVSAISDWSYHGSTALTTNYTFTGGVEHTIVVEHFEGINDATLVFTMKRPSDDVGACDWSISDEYAHSSPNAWSDSPGRDYANNSTCHLALRGGVDLSTLAEPPRMTFWDIWDLDNFDKAWLQIREYGDTGPWYAKLIHENYQQQLSWRRQTIDLANYTAINTGTGSPVTMDWTNRVIEFRFVLEADGSNTENGWWVDDIAIEENVLNVYTVGFSDTMEVGDTNWQPGGNWAISAEHTRRGNGAWSDSPGTWYPAGTNSTLELNGIVDLTTSESVDPELVFYHSWYLGANDKIFVEVSTDQVNWVSLTPSRPSGALQSSSRNDAFVREVISLNSTENPYQGTTFYLRFRLVADGSGEGDGWWIDDITIQNHPTGNMPYPFFDNMEGGPANWVADGQWSLSPEKAYSGSSAWSDSPGTNYADDTNSSLQSSRPFQLLSNQATNPELSFWHIRDLGPYDKLYVEASTDGGTTWTALWSYQYTDSTSAHPEAPGVGRNEFNTQLGWEYVSIDMRPYISDTTPFYLRFRLDALTDNRTGDGVWIDDIRLAEHVGTPHAFPFTDDMEGSTNWRAGGTWTLSDEASHSGSYAWSDSPGTDYLNNSWSVLQLTNPIDLTGVTTGDFPVLTWWDRFQLDRYDYARVQVSSWQGPDWDDWSAWTEVYQQYYTATMSWNRRQVDLRPYAGKTIRIRFILDALRNDRTDPGWWIDDVSVAPYNPQVFTLDLYDGAETMSDWVAEGTWGLGDIYRGSGSGPAALGPGAWETRFYDTREFGYCGSDSYVASLAIRGVSFWCNSANRTFSVQETANLAEIDFNCDSSSSPNPDGTCNTTPWKADHNHIAIQFVRPITVEAGYYEFSIRTDDGARLFVDRNPVTYPDPTNDPGLILDRWYDQGPTTHTTSVYLEAGIHMLELWWYENSGGAVIQLDVARQSFSFHDSPGNPDVDYQHRSNMSLILDGVVDMTGAVNPSLSWYERYDVDDGDCMIVEISLPYATGGFERWREIYNRCDQSNGAWTLRNVGLRDHVAALLGVAPGSVNFTDLMLTFRFRLDARVDSDTGSGWWIDDIVLAD